MPARVLLGAIGRALSLAIMLTLGWSPTALGTATPEADAALALERTAVLRASQAVVGNVVSDFTLLDREGRPVRLSQYRGKPLLVSFIYTGCFQVCPLTTKSLQDALNAGRGGFNASQFNVVSIGFNQPADSPQSMKAFALQHRIDAPNWEFLSPHASIVDRLTSEFGFSYAATPAGFDHVLHVTMLDAEGRIYRQVYGSGANPDAIGEPLRQLLRNAPVPQRARLEDLIDRVIIVCTVYDPDTGRYRVKYDLLIEVAGGVTFALSMAWFFLAEWRSRRRAARTASRTT